MKSNKEISTRPITPEEIDMLRPYTKEEKTALWGQEHTTTPTLVNTVFGDGGSLISLEPANSRPDFYIMLAPSNITNWREALDFIADNEELIYEPIEEEFGNSDDHYDDEGVEIDDIDIEPGCMPLNIGSGYTAGHYTDFKRTI